MATLHKQCSKCKQHKPLHDFPPNGKAKGTGRKLYRSACKACERVRNKARYTPKPPKKASELNAVSTRLASEFVRWEASQNPFGGYYQVDPVSSCWSWRGALCPAGYGVRDRKDSGTTLAHRAVMEHLGHGLSNMHVHHECRNRKCINPAHLRVLTPAEHISLHSKEKLTGHDIGPALPKGTHKASLTAKQAIIKYLEALPKEALGVPVARPKQYQATTAKALRVATISLKTGVSGYLVSKLLREIPLYEQLKGEVYIAV